MRLCTHALSHHMLTWQAVRTSEQRATATPGSSPRRTAPRPVSTKSCSESTRSRQWTAAEQTRVLQIKDHFAYNPSTLENDYSLLRVDCVTGYSPIYRIDDAALSYNVPGNDADDQRVGSDERELRVGQRRAAASRRAGGLKRGLQCKLPRNGEGPDDVRGLPRGWHGRVLWRLGRSAVCHRRGWPVLSGGSRVVGSWLRTRKLPGCVRDCICVQRMDVRADGCPGGMLHELAHASAVSSSSSLAVGQTVFPAAVPHDRRVLPQSERKQRHAWYRVVDDVRPRHGVRQLCRSRFLRGGQRVPPERSTAVVLRAHWRVHWPPSSTARTDLHAHGKLQLLHGTPLSPSTTRHSTPGGVELLHAQHQQVSQKHAAFGNLQNSRTFCRAASVSGTTRL